MLLNGRVALVTGASSGIGSETALALAIQGAKVVINYSKNQAGAEAVESAIGKQRGAAFIFKANVARSSEVEAMVNEVHERWGPIDILVNNAGAGVGRHTLKDMTEELWDEAMAINLKSAFLCAKAVWEDMANKKAGSIINISSIAARNGGSVGVAAYAAAKGGLITYTKSLAKELAPHIRVNAIVPGVIDTPLHSKTPPELMRSHLAAIPLGRIGNAAEVADVVVFLASDAARYMTGQMIDVNGGMWMN